LFCFFPTPLLFVFPSKILQENFFLCEKITIKRIIINTKFCYLSIYIQLNKDRIFFKKYKNPVKHNTSNKSPMRSNPNNFSNLKKFSNPNKINELQQKSSRIFHKFSLNFLSCSNYTIPFFLISLHYL